jgi:hypothetical protein
MEEITESVKAIQEAAKATSKALDTLDKAGGFFGQVFGSLVVDGVGIVADRVKYMRIEQAVRLAEKTEKLLADRGVDQTISVEPKIAIPLIESATLETNDELHTIWASLLANAMDPNSEEKVTRSHVSVLREMSALDVSFLDRMVSEKDVAHSGRELSELNFDKKKLASVFGVSDRDAELCLLNLLRLSCIKPGLVPGGMSYGEYTVSAYMGTDLVQLSEFGVSLVRAARAKAT